MACGVEEGKPVDQKVLVRGDYNSPGEDAPKAFPKILSKSTDPAIAANAGSGRLQLAEWITRADNPLPARVMANRIWQWHFGDGLVRTPDNFGKMGERPTNPELLDFLATRFVRNGWSIKSMHRLIMLSSAYQMASDTDDATREKDPENLQVTRFRRQRLAVEEIRDSILAINNLARTALAG